MKVLASPIRHRGASLLIALVMLVAVTIVGLSAARIALQGERTARNERDRQVAFQAAEAALLDAELDIEKSPDATRSRSSMFAPDSAEGFPADRDAPCASGRANRALGLCRSDPGGTRPAWQAADFDDETEQGVHTVAFGTFTGQRFPVARGSLPARVPRYVIERLGWQRPGEAADRRTGFYRITAIGYGAQPGTQVVLQTTYRKES